MRIVILEGASTARVLVGANAQRVTSAAQAKRAAREGALVLMPERWHGRRAGAEEALAIRRTVPGARLLVVGDGSAHEIDRARAYGLTGYATRRSLAAVLRRLSAALGVDLDGDEPVRIRRAS